MCQYRSVAAGQLVEEERHCLITADDGLQMMNKTCFAIFYGLTAVTVVFCVYALLGIKGSVTKHIFKHNESNKSTHNPEPDRLRIEGSVTQHNFRHIGSNTSCNNQEPDCQALFEGNPGQIELASTFTPCLPSSDIEVANTASDCPSVVHKFGFITRPLSEEEENFPIAFSILVYKDAIQIAGLLSAIYRPQNVYCIHVDLKADQVFRDAVSAVSRCLTNVFLSSRSVDVQWGEFSVLEPEIVCMEDLWRHSSPWKYFINLTGQEFPLKTNWELVQILKAFKGANSLQATRNSRWEERWNGAGSPPAGIRPTKGSVHVTVNRDFVDFVLHSDTGQAFLKWTRGTIIPDETFFSSLNHNPHLGIKGTYTGEAKTDQVTYPFITRLKIWDNKTGQLNNAHLCGGQRWVRHVCILNHLDLPLLASSPELFANKFHVGYSSVALRCLGEAIYNRTRDRTLSVVPAFNTSFYENLSFVKDQVLESTFNKTSGLRYLCFILYIVIIVVFCLRSRLLRG